MTFIYFKYLETHYRIKFNFVDDMGRFVKASALKTAVLGTIHLSPLIEMEFRDHLFLKIEDFDIVELCYQYQNNPQFVLNVVSPNQSKKMRKMAEICVNIDLDNLTMSLRSHLELFIPHSAQKIGRMELVDADGDTVPVIIGTKERKKIVRQVSLYAMANYGKKQVESNDFKFALAKIIITLFPFFRTEEGPYFGADSFFHPETRIGFLVNALKYRSKDPGEPETKKAKLEEKTSIKDDIEELKTCILPLDKLRAIELMETTYKQRKSMMNKDPKLYQDFPFYFSDPSLVIEDFKLFYPPQMKNFTKMWDQMVPGVHAVFSDEGKTVIFENPPWNNDVQLFIKMLQLTPASPNPTEVTQSDMIEAIEKFIIFSKDDIFEDTDERVKTLQPIIIALGDDRTQIRQYQIKVDEDFMFIDGNTPFQVVFLTYYACFHVFGVKYDYALTSFMSFFDTYVFKITKNTNFTNVTGVYNAIMAKIKILKHT
ncbi:hypothetical protein ACFFRR_011660 [Megaselia abdita]